MDFSIEEAMQVATHAALSAGQILRDMLESAEVREKAPKDLVTDADIAAQKAIESQIMTAFPTHLFLGEESEKSIGTSDSFDDALWRWVVDPLDGTANYVHRLPNFAVSIALVQGSRIAMGVVFDPMACELYAATQGGGATVNGKSISASKCVQLDRAIVAASFPPQVQRDSLEVDEFVEILVRSQSVRRLGSAALNLCYVAQGRLDAYWANNLKPWDLAAGALIATESGAVISKPDGRTFNPWVGELLVAATLPLKNEIQNCFIEVQKKRTSR